MALHPRLEHLDEANKGGFAEYQRIHELDDIREGMESGDEVFVGAGEESVDFYTGKFGEGQWDADDILDLRSQKRPVLQLPIIQPKVDLMVGIEEQNRTNWRAIPVESADKDQAKLGTALLFYLDRQRAMQRLFSRQYKDGVMVGRGWNNVYVETGQFFDFELFAKKVPWRDIKIDPDAIDPDVSTWARLMRTRWMPLDFAIAEFPDELSDVKGLDDMKNMAPTGLDMEPRDESEKRVSSSPDLYARGDPINFNAYLDDVRMRVKVIELWERDRERQWFVYDIVSGEIYKPGFKRQSEAVDRYKQLDEKVKGRFSIISRIVPLTHYTMYSGMRLLRDKVPNPYRHNEFPYVPYFWRFEDNGKEIVTYGSIEGMKDAQREKNKRRSQVLDILNRSPKGGGIFAEGQLTQDDFNKAARGGTWVGIKGLGGKKKLSDVVYPWDNSYLAVLNSIVGLEQLAEADMKEIAGAIDPLMGIASGSKESGFAAQTRIKQGMLPLREQLDSLDVTKVKTLTMCLQNMQQYFSKEKIRRIVGTMIESQEGEEGKIPEKTINEFVNNFGAMKFDIRLDRGDNSPTMRTMKAAQVGELMRTGIPGAMGLLEVWLKLSDIEASEEILAKIEQDRMAMLMLQQMTGDKAFGKQAGA